MGRLFLLVFTLLPLIEIAFFIVIGRAIGLWPTLLGVAATALMGALILRFQGLSILADIRGALRRGRLPAREFADATLVGLAGILLLLPGYFSDLVGLLLLIPAVRRLIVRLLGRHVLSVVSTGATSGRTRTVGRSRTIDLGDGGYRER